MHYVWLGPGWKAEKAEAAQRGVNLAAQQFAEQLGQGPHIVLDAIHAAQGLIFASLELKPQ